MLKSLVSPIWLDWDEVVREGMKAWNWKKLQSIVHKLALGQLCTTYGSIKIVLNFARG